MNDPETVFEMGELPDDLKWLVAQFRLQPNDPALLLLAWHWKRVQQGGDTIQNATQELKAALDTRVERMLASTEALESIADHFSEIRASLDQKPLRISERIDAELREPIRASVEACSNIALPLKSLLQETEIILRKARRQQMIAAFIAGIFVGAMLLPWTYFYFFSH